MAANRIELLAENSLQWVDGEKFAFLWDSELITGHYDRMRDTYYFITDVDEEKREAIANWLQPKLLEMDDRERVDPEEEEEDEENWD